MARPSQAYREGKKPMRNQGLMYSKPKKGIHLTLTPESIKKLREIETATETSVSEIIERLIRSDLDHKAIVLNQNSDTETPDA